MKSGYDLDQTRKGLIYFQPAPIPKALCLLINCNAQPHPPQLGEGGNLTMSVVNMPHPRSGSRYKSKLRPGPCMGMTWRFDQD